MLFLWADTQEGASSRAWSSRGTGSALGTACPQLFPYLLCRVLTKQSRTNPSLRQEPSPALLAPGGGGGSSALGQSVEPTEMASKATEGSVFTAPVLLLSFV